MQLEEKYNWNLKDIFQSEDEFQIAKKKIINNLDKISEFKGNLCNTSENLYNCYKIYEQTLELFDKVYSYGMFKYHLNMADQEGIKKFKEVESLSSEFSIKTAFMVPEISYTDEEIIYKYLRENTDLKKYERDIREIVEKRKHILNKNEEELLSNYSEVFSAPENIFDILTNAEFKFGNIIDEDGKEVEMTDATYSIFLKSKDENVRKQAFSLMYNKYSEYINTITEMYLANVKKTAITAKIRKYDSSLDAATENDDANIKIYEALMKGVNDILDINHEFINLKKELLNEKDS